MPPIYLADLRGFTGGKLSRFAPDVERPTHITKKTLATRAVNEVQVSHLVVGQMDPQNWAWLDRRGRPPFSDDTSEY